MRRTIRRVARKMPAGLALHGTPYRNWPSIKRRGLRLGRKSLMVHGCPLPSANDFKQAKVAPLEVLERAIGSTILAAAYGAAKIPFERVNEALQVERLPSIIIFRGHASSRPLLAIQGKLIGDANLGRTHPDNKTYRTFGMETYPTIPPTDILRMVRLTKREYLEILRKAGKRPARGRYLRRHIYSKLIVKVLKAIRSLAEYGGGVASH